MCWRASGAHTKNDDSHESQNPRDNAAHQRPLDVGIIQKLCRKKFGLAEVSGRRPFAAAMISLRQRRKTASVFHPLHGT